MFKHGATLDSPLVVAYVDQKSFSLFMGKPQSINLRERHHIRELKILALLGRERLTKLRL